MKKTLSVIVVGSILILPHIVSAAWWNPFSWNIFRTSSTQKTSFESQQHLSQLERASTTPSPALTPKSVKSEVYKDTKSIPVQNSNKNTVLAPIKDVPVLNNQGITASDVSSLLETYSVLKAQVAEEKSAQEINIQLPLRIQYVSSLGQLLEKINTDMGYLYQVQGWSSIPTDVGQIYKQKLGTLQQDFRSEQASFSKDINIQQAQYNASAPIREAQTAVLVRENSPECIDAKQVLDNIDAQIAPLQVVEKKRNDEYIRTGSYVTPSLSSSDSNKLTSLIVRGSGAYTNYSIACRGVIPESPKIYTTNCYSLGYGVSCYTQ